MSRRRRLSWVIIAGLVATLGGWSTAAAAVPARPATAHAGGVQALAGPGAAVPDPAAPKRQLRALWIASVVNIDWPSRPGLDPEAARAEYRSWLDLAQRYHFNAVIVQVRPTADAFWPSPYEPWSEWLTGHRDGADPGWDPLAFMVAETHRRNLEFHAWFNPYRVSMPGGAGADIDKLAPNHPVRQHPEWAVAYPVDAPGSRLYYNPGIPAVRSFVEEAILDAVSGYDIDGVHLDDYYYPYPVPGQDFDDDATYASYGAGFASKADWRRDNVNRLIRELGGRIKAIKPWVKFGVGPFGIWRNKGTDPLGSDTGGLQSYDALFADTRLWVRQEWIDYIVPQVYWNIGLPAADYAVLVPWWSDVVSGTRVQLYIGQADYKIGTLGAWLDPAEMSDHLAFNRDYPQVLGDVHFSAKDVRADRLAAVTRYTSEYYARPALVPRMTQLPARPVLPPLVVRAERSGDDPAPVTLSWHAPLSGLWFAAATSYAVYRFDGLTLPGSGGFADAIHLIATVRAGGGRTDTFTDTTARSGHRYTYYVTALDRLWNESLPSLPAFVR